MGSALDENTFKTEILELEKKPAVKPGTRRAKLLKSETHTSFDVLTTQLIKTKNSPNNKKVESEEPSSSKKIKKEISNNRWEPKNWELMLENIRKMRSNDNAPVDTMGCHKCADESADEKVLFF